MITCLSIIIPLYNEENTIVSVLKKLASIKLINNIKKEVIIINDCSTDSSEDCVNDFRKQYKNLNTIFLTHNKNQGKGGAIKTGIQYATGEYTIIQDADLELNPDDINLLLQKVNEQNVDIVYGSRFLKNKKHEKEMLANRIANKFLTHLSNSILKLELTDMQTCYKLVPTDIFQSIELLENRFAFDPELTAKLAKHKKLKWAEVAITYEPRTQKEGKKIRWSDGFRQIYSIIKYGLLK